MAEVKALVQSVSFEILDLNIASKIEFHNLWNLDSLK
jgi:hypothetical protein